MFHLSLPVESYRDCIEFYRSCFDAEIVELTPKAVNIFAFGAQITLHDDPSSSLTAAARTQLHFGSVVPVGDWFVVRDRLHAAGCRFRGCINPDAGSGRRGKLIVTDPSGNLIEVNSTPG